MHSLFSSFFKIWRETSRGFEPRSLDSESRVLTVTPRGRLPQKTSGSDCSLWKYTLGLVPLEEREHFERSHVLLRSLTHLIGCLGLSERGAIWYRERPLNKRYPWVGKDSFSHRDALKQRRWCCRTQCCILFSVQFSTSGARPRADLNRDRWIQSPEC